jgi:hypothetical protein
MNLSPFAWFSRKRLERRVEKSWETFRFPGIFENPSHVTVFCGPGPASTWPGIYLACSLQKFYKNSTHHLILQESLADLASTLPWQPGLYTYATQTGHISPEIPAGSLLFNATTDSTGLAEVVLAISPALSVAPEGCDLANVRLRVHTDRYPERVYGICQALGIPPDTRWRPSISARLTEAASRILAPVSHRSLPYILATSQAAAILERRRAELPLRTVILDGKGRDVPEGIPEGVLMALISGASAVITDRDSIWVHASALGVPVLGYDRRGVFQPWGKPPPRGETALLDEWAELLRRGW